MTMGNLQRRLVESPTDNPWGGAVVVELVLPVPWAQALHDMAQQIGRSTLQELRAPFDLAEPAEKGRALVEVMQHLADQLHQQGLRGW